MYLVGWAAYRQTYLHGVVKERLGQLAYLLGHGGGEHDGLSLFGQMLGYLEDIVGKTHVEHAVGLIKYEERYTREVYVAQRKMADKSSRSSNDYISPLLHAALLLFVSDAVVAAIHRHRTNVWQMVGESLKSLVDLLCQFACGRHDDTIDGIGRVVTV